MNILVDKLALEGNDICYVSNEGQSWIVKTNLTFDPDYHIFSTFDELVNIDRTLALIKDLPSGYHAWRAETKSMWVSDKKPCGNTYFIEFIIVKDGYSNELDDGIEGRVQCWIVADDKEKAFSKAESLVISDGWTVEECVDQLEVLREDVQEDEDFLEYYLQAQTDGEVLVYYAE